MTYAFYQIDLSFKIDDSTELSRILDGCINKGVRVHGVECRKESYITSKMSVSSFRITVVEGDNKRGIKKMKKCIKSFVDVLRENSPRAFRTVDYAFAKGRDAFAITKKSIANEIVIVDSVPK